MRDASNRFINPISIADSATSYPFGYDTIKFTLKQDDCPEYDLMSEVPIMVGENGILESGNGYTFKKQEFRFFVNPNGIRLITGSLVRFYRQSKTNSPPLTYSELIRALETLEELIPLPWERAQVYRVDLTADLKLKNNPSSYLSNFGRLNRFHKQDNHGTAVYYYSSKEFSASKRTFVVYNKSEQASLSENILRLELRWANSALRNARRKNRVLTLNDLCAHDTYISLIEEWMALFEQINLVQHPPGHLNYSSPSAFEKSLSQVGARQYNYDYLINEADQQAPDPSSKSRIKKKIAYLFSAPSSTESPNKIEEITHGARGIYRQSVAVPQELTNRKSA